VPSRPYLRVVVESDRATMMIGKQAGPSAGRHASGRAAIADADDRRLIQAAQEGSSEAFEGLFRCYWAHAHRAAYLIVHDAAAAEDIAQESFLAAIRTLDRFDRRRPFGPWLHRIVVNRAIDWTRARALRHETSDDSWAEVADPSEGNWPAPGESDELLGALRALPPDRRAVVVLRYLLGYTPGEIARLLELPRGTVNSRLRRGLDALAAGLGEAGS
jgi:RNA polymerase sigma-70 factor (ECF subfamily)